MTLTGAQLKAALEQQYAIPIETGRTRPAALAPSDGFTYAVDMAKPEGSRVSDMRLNGKPSIRQAATGSSLNNYLASGGDGLSAFTQGTDITDKGIIDLDALVAWIAPGRTPPKPDRIRFASLAQRRLVEAAQLARVQALAFAAQEAERLDADPEVLADRALVEVVGLPGQLELAVDRLVRHAEQSPVGHAEAVALRGDSRRFHVDRDRPALVEALADWVKRSSQLRSSVVTTVPVRRRVFTLSSSPPVTSTAASNSALCTSAIAGSGISAGSTSSRTWSSRKIGVGEHIIADALARSQAAAMADHQPHFGPQHRDMVADRLRVRRTDADVDQGDPDAPVGHQMVGRHLVPPPCARSDLRLGVGQIARGRNSRPERTAPCTDCPRGAARRSRSARTRRRSGRSW